MRTLQARVSYQVGWFGTYRLTQHGRYRAEPSSWTSDIQHALGRLTASFEVSNLTDAQVFDTYGVQRPGRAYYAKLVAEL